MAQQSRERLKHSHRLEELVEHMPDYVWEYVQAKKRLDYSPSSLLGYMHDFQLFFQWLITESIAKDCKEIKEIPYTVLESLKKAEVESFFDYLREPYKKNEYETITRSSERVLRIQNALKSLFNYLTTETEIETGENQGECYFYRNVMAKIKTKKKAETKSSRAKRISSDMISRNVFIEFMEFLDKEYVTLRDNNDNLLLSEREKKLYERDKERFMALYAVAFGSGVRVSELCNITLSDIDFKKETIDVIRKGNKRDTILISKLGLEYLNKYLSIRQERYKPAKENKYVFLTKYNGKANPISPRTVQSSLKRHTTAFNETGKSISPHKLRHSFASEWILNGGDLVTLRDQLGQNSIETTSLYTNISLDEARRIMNKMDEE
ncbi:tyrosine recombinase XerS [Mangrovibacillus cuniculi]|uniref:Tyrosine recombinase XerS n=1 Tax=Mangrovibacillus cuniculi TaxID=2593652 RepID=A0A7S8HG30_9BACI|nr:tyrosine recombinase XerS [Mangrovibacillus cuniculi]QPC47554.1 tyrosine recombinase XerS [Mangrovibacillus cuniculi]